MSEPRVDRRLERRIRRISRRGRILVVCAILAGTLLAAVFTARAISTARTTSTICQKVDRLTLALESIVAASSRPLRPGDYGYAYQQAHPGEARSRGAGVKRALVILRQAACDPASLPAVKLAP